MIRRHRSLFTARRRGNALYVGPKFAGPEPHYLPKLDELLNRGGGGPERGKVNHVGIYHDEDCSIHEGGACDCNPDVKFIPAPAGF